MRNFILASLLFFSFVSVSANAAGVLDAIPEAGVQGTPSVSISITDASLSDSERLAACQTKFDAAVKVLKAENLVILKTIACYVVNVGEAYGSIAFIR